LTLGETLVLIWKTLAGALGYIFEFRTQLGKALLFPLVILTAMGFYELDDGTISWPIFVTVFLVEMFIYTLIAVATHRVILLGPSSIPEWGILMPSKRELLFLIYSIGVGLIMVPIGFLAFIPLVGLPIAILAIAYVAGRLSLIFPAIATDLGWTFSDSWKATEQYIVLMMFIAVGLPIIMGIPEYLLSYLPYATVLVTIVSVFSMVFLVAALSVAFKVITSEHNENRQDPEISSSP
jgi:hypothetical protein